MKKNFYIAPELELLNLLSEAYASSDDELNTDVPDGSLSIVD
jgi:hypothetical protein